ncbi:single-stranded DNA-dependent ATPase [Aureococcus anophagefferens]|nr:single-stranded DNA-dependent ATPase [Aureococcus anophagefferens]
MATPFRSNRAPPPNPLDENEDEVRWDGGGDGDFEARADDGGSQHLLELIGDLQAGSDVSARGGTSQPRSSTSGLASMLRSPGVDDREIALSSGEPAAAPGRAQASAAAQAASACAPLSASSQLDAPPPDAEDDDPSPL